MKRKLSDHDELAFWWAAQFCSRDIARPILTNLRVEAGRVWATDLYTLASFPVEAEWEGCVAAHDALAGGTVDVDSVGQFPNFDGMVARWKSRADAILDVDEVERLRPWVGRKVHTLRWSDDDSPSIAYLAPRWVWGAQYLVLPGDGRLFGLPRSERGPALQIQAPWLARAVVAVADLAGGGVRLDGGIECGRDPLVVSPIGDEWSPEDPWTAVMGIRSSIVDDWHLPKNGAS